MGSREVILELAREAGFDLAGIAPLAPPPDAQRLDAWLSAGRHGSMDYLERYRERLLDPRLIDPRGRSLLIVGLGHSRAPIECADGTRIARYAAGRDYHNWMQKRLRSLGRRLQREGLAQPGRTIVDAGPLLERSHAQVAGSGVHLEGRQPVASGLWPLLFPGRADPRSGA